MCEFSGPLHFTYISMARASTDLSHVGERFLGRVVIARLKKNKRVEYSGLTREGDTLKQR